MEIDKVLLLFGKLLYNIPFAPLTITKVGTIVYKSFRRRGNYCFYLFLFNALYSLSIIMGLLGIFMEGAWVIGLFLYLCFCGCMAVIRTRTRNILKIKGSLIEDLLVSVILYPNVAVQMEKTVATLHPEENENDQAV